MTAIDDRPPVTVLSLALSRQAALPLEAGKRLVCGNNSTDDPQQPFTNRDAWLLHLSFIRMNPVVRVLLVAALSASIPACERWSWPPYENSLRKLFAENKERFEEIRQNMLADDVEEVDSAQARGRGYRCAGPGCPRTIDQQDVQLRAKYSELIEERSIFKYTLRDGDFNVHDLPLPPTQGGNFVFRFVRSEKTPLIPHCDEGKARLPTCGACYEDLDPNWHMYWMWYPRDLGPDWDGRVGEGLPTPEEIERQHETALDRCLEAGRNEMGLGPRAE